MATTKEQCKALIKEYLLNNDVNSVNKSYLYNKELDKYELVKGIVLVDFDEYDLVELIYNRIRSRSVSSFHAARGAYSKFFDWLVKKEIVSNNPCLQSPMSLEAFTNFLSYEDSLKPYDRQTICDAIDANTYNKNYYNIIMLSIFEGIYSSYRQLVELSYSDVDFEKGVIHTENGDRIPSARLLKSIKEMKTEKEFLYTYRSGTLVTIKDRVVPYIYIKKSDIVDFADDTEAKHRTQKSMYKLLQRFNDRNGTDFSQQKLWESGVIQRVVSSLGEKEFVDMMLNPTTGKNEHERLNKILYSTYGWDFHNELAIDKFKTTYRYHAVRLKRELNL